MPCRKRGCRPSLYASDLRILALANLKALTSVRLIVQTAPGAGVLTWDRRWCDHPPLAPCSGRRGCRVNEDARLRWEREFARAFRLVRQRVVTTLQRKGLRSPYVAFVDENQARGVLHRNIVLEEGPAAREFHRLWIEYAHEHPALGFVDRKPVVMNGLAAGVYIASYVTGVKGESSMEARLLKAPAHTRVFYCSPRLTKRTHVTMRTLRMGRRLWACIERGARRPKSGCLYGVFDGVVVDVQTGEIVRSIWGQGP